MLRESIPTVLKTVGKMGGKIQKIINECSMTMLEAVIDVAEKQDTRKDACMEVRHKCRYII